MTIYLNAECFTYFPNEVNFWAWAEQTFPNTRRGLPDVNELPGGRLADDDIVLQYSTLGPCPIPGGKKVAMLWELHPEMKARLGGGQWDGILERIDACGRESDFRTTATPAMLPYYEHLGRVDVLPLAVDTERFRTPKDAEEVRAIRKKFNLPLDQRIGFWAGTSHAMKGFDDLLVIAERMPDVHWVICWKDRRQAAPGRLPEGRATEFFFLPQDQIAELMRACGHFACTGRLRPYFMVEWEAMAADLLFLYPAAPDREFTIHGGASPRAELLARGWDRATAAGQWLSYLEQVAAA